MNARNIELLRNLTKLKWLDIQLYDKNAHFPASTPEQFWKDFAPGAWLARLRDSGLKIKTLNKLPDGTWEVNLDHSAIRDLTILSGATISRLSISHTAVSDLTALRGMALKQFWLYDTKVTDLSPLKGMPLQTLNLGETKVADLSALRGMPLHTLRLHDCTELTDLSPLAEARELTTLTLPPNAKNIEFLRAFPKLERLSYKEDASNGYRPDKTAAEFWQEYDAQKK